MNRKKTVAAIVVGVLVVTGAFGAGAVMAVNTTTTGKSIVKRLSERFNLNADDVKKVFTEAQEERLQAMRDALEEQLDEAVKEGKITEAQKRVILDKLSKIKEKHEELLKLRRELREWAEENDIDLREILKLGHGHAPYGRHGPRGHFGSPMFW